MSAPIAQSHSEMPNAAASGAQPNGATAGGDAAEHASMYDAIQKKLRKTHDAFVPALRQIEDRKHIQAIAGASVKLNFLLAGIVVALALSNIYLGWQATHPDRQYFAADNGRFVPLVPQSQPYRKTADVIQYARERVTRSFTLDFLNWRQQLEDVRPAYTKEGFKSFLEALKNSGVLEAVKEKRMNLTITAGTGVLTREGIDGGVYQWVVEFPAEVRLEGQSTRLPAQRFLTTVRIERVPTVESVEGLGLGQLVTAPM